MGRWCALVLLLAWLPARAQTEPDELWLDSPALSARPMRVRVLLPPGYADGTQRYPVLYVNDGQDLEDVGGVETVQSLESTGAIEPLIVVAIDMPPDRLRGYGLFDRGARHAIPAQTEYGPVGANAWAYAQWITGTLVPEVDARYRTRASGEQRAIVGWSLGALSAFGLGWEYPGVFGRIGAFSPSFWVSADRGTPDDVQATRLAHRLVDAGASLPRPKLFVAVGTDEETDDRDGDGVIDVIDDARDLLEGWKAPDGTARKGLSQWGYRVNPDYARHPTPAEAVLYLLEGGQHNQASWTRVLPVFLQWAFGTRSPGQQANP